MSTFNTLSWRNENALSGYPFISALDVQDFIVDASFVQFDNFVPTLNYATINSNSVVLNITFDYGQHDNVVYTKDKFDEGESSWALKIYAPANNRYLGTLSFGVGLATLWNDYIGRKLIFNKVFISETTRSIPLDDAVYTFDGYSGVVTLGRTETDSSIFYNTTLDLNSITFNAVTGHFVEPQQVKSGLRKINLVSPLNNNINIASNDVLKITPFNNASLTISLVSGRASAAFSLPTLIS